MRSGATMFNSTLLIELIKKAQGNRPMYQFAEECGINSGNLSRILNNKNPFPPKPETLKKIAAKSHNGVTYKDLMAAAGFMDGSEDSANVTKPELFETCERDLEKIFEALKKGLVENQDSLTLSGVPVAPETIESLLSSLTFVSEITYSVNKACIK